MNRNQYDLTSYILSSSLPAISSRRYSAPLCSSHTCVSGVTNPGLTETFISPPVSRMFAQIKSTETRVKTNRKLLQVFNNGITLTSVSYISVNGRRCYHRWQTSEFILAVDRSSKRTPRLLTYRAIYALVPYLYYSTSLSHQTGTLVLVSRMHTCR